MAAETGTATATNHTVNVIKKILQMTDPLIIQMSCIRDNLSYSVVAKKDNQAKQQVVLMISTDHAEACDIVPLKLTQ